ncbi:uroporphyrinogen decarboxylase [Desulfocicer vacuolatum DSM 3385]|uniref:Uroporphyrinogen decarboxylase n=1 Tax=Desulfocicer vacuolatum DSM 3385 TaxID=1121400 RepID=A0A1W2DWY4_9BACT|nr:uroporphyrinogen decarboxylase family protein [Desulfocicer vacuolatum]SMD02001.1 uroporphyrinogen decarboxylase [Desulfocicer vacuolatum DSM 3385]
MNSKERMTAVLSGKHPDRSPVSMNLALYGAGLTGCPLVEYYSDPEAYALGQEQVSRIFQPDILFAPFAMPLYAQSFGGTLRFYKDQPPNIKKPVLSVPDDFHLLALPDPDNNPSLVYMRRAIRIMGSRHGNEVVVAGVAMDPVSLPIMLMGLDKWLQTFLFEETMATDILGWILPFFREWVNILFEEGASFVALPMAFTTPAILPRKLVLERCMPVLKQAFDGVKGPLILHSTGAPFSPFIDLFATLPNVKGAELNCKDSFQDTRANVGEQLLLMGNLEGPNCNQWSVKQTREKCKTILQDRKDDPFFILGTSGPDIPIDTPPAIIHAIGRSVEDVNKW